jgi:LacI family transcriptional regulator
VEARETVAGIRDVAARSGVSIATVSRVFNGSPRVSEATRARVLARARELNYVPNAAARTLVRQRSQLLGVVLDTGDHPDVAHPFFQEVLAGLKSAVGEHDYDLLLFAKEQHAYVDRALHHRVDGLLLLSVHPHGPELERLLATRLPAVAVDLEIVGPRAGFVASDDAGGGRAAARHLRDRGHTRTATVTGPLDRSSSAQRLAGFREELPETLVAEGDFYGESGYAAAQRLLALAEPPTAIFAASDLMALGVLQAARDRGLRVPHDLAVVGFDDVALAAAADPPLTTVRQDKRGLGAAAGEAVVASIESPDVAPPELRLPVELVVRGSS